MNKKKKITALLLGGIVAIYGFVFFYYIQRIEDLTPEAILDREEMIRAQKEELNDLRQARAGQPITDEIFEDIKKEVEALRSKK